MSAGSVDQIVRTPGRLCYEPSDLSSDFPCGGTEIGFVRQVALRLRQRSTDIHAEEWDESSDIVLGAMRIEALSCVIRQYDADAIAWIFPSVSTVSSDKVVDIPGDAKPGALGSARAKSLLFVPDNPDHTAVLLYQAIPTIAEEGAEIQSSVLAERSLHVLFRPIRANGDVGQMGKRSRLTLPA